MYVKKAVEEMKPPQHNKVSVKKALEEMKPPQLNWSVDVWNVPTFYSSLQMNQGDVGGINVVKANHLLQKLGKLNTKAEKEIMWLLNWVHWCWWINVAVANHLLQIFDKLNTKAVNYLIKNLNW